MSAKGRGSKMPKDDKYARDLEGFIEQYIKDTGDQAWTTMKIAAWAIEKGLWKQYKIQAVKQLARELTRAAGKVFLTDEDGKRVRKYHPYRLGNDQPMLWDSMETITHENMDNSKTTRRDGIAGRVAQLNRDVGYYNNHHNPGEPLLFDPDFGPDLAEEKQSSEYNDLPPDDEPDDVSEPRTNPRFSPTAPAPLCGPLRCAASLSSPSPAPSHPSTRPCGPARPLPGLSRRSVQSPVRRRWLE